jgi:hypothetical protein
MLLAFLFLKDLFEGENLGDFEVDYFSWDLIGNRDSETMKTKSAHLIGNRDSETMKMKSVRADVLKKSHSFCKIWGEFTASVCPDTLS